MRYSAIAIVLLLTLTGCKSALMTEVQDRIQGINNGIVAGQAVTEAVIAERPASETMQIAVQAKPVLDSAAKDTQVLADIADAASGEDWLVSGLKAVAGVASMFGPYGAAASAVLLPLAGWLERRRRAAKAQTVEVASAIEAAKIDGKVDFTDPATKVILHKNMSDSTKAIVDAVR